MKGGRSIASVRASVEGPVDLLTLSRVDFKWLMDESPLTEKAIVEMVQKRLEERKGTDRRKKNRGLFG